MKSTIVAEALASAAQQTPPMRGPIVTIHQFEERHPGTKNRMRHFILHADAGCTGYDKLKGCVIRVGRSVMLDEAGVLDWLASHSGQPPSPARNPHGRGGRGSRTKAREK